jgi:hypothetical protein
MITAIVTEAEKCRWNGVFPNIPDECFVSLHVFEHEWSAIINLDKDHTKDVIEKNHVDFRPYKGILISHMELTEFGAMIIYNKLHIIVIDDSSGKVICNPDFTKAVPPEVRSGTRRPGI